MIIFLQLLLFNFSLENFKWKQLKTLVFFQVDDVIQKQRRHIKKKSFQVLHFLLVQEEKIVNTLLSCKLVTQISKIELKKKHNYDKMRLSTNIYFLRENFKYRSQVIENCVLQETCPHVQHKCGHSKIKLVLPGQECETLLPPSQIIDGHSVNC